MSDAALSLTIQVEDGKLMPTDGQARQIRAFLHSRDGKAVAVKFSRPKSTRTIDQNRFYWGVVLTGIAEHTGHTPEEIHEVLKDLFLPRRFITLGGHEVSTQKTTTDLSVTEFAHYLEQVTAWAAQELGIAFPDAPLVKPQRATS